MLPLGMNLKRCTDGVAGQGPKTPIFDTDGVAVMASFPGCRYGWRTGLLRMAYRACDFLRAG